MGLTRLNFRSGFLPADLGSESYSFRSISFPYHLSTLPLKSLETRQVESNRNTSAVVKAVNGLDQVEVDISLSPRVNSVKPSKTVAITDQATALVQAGFQVIRLAAGEPDFDTPAPIAEVALVPGDAFGDNNCIRVSYATSLTTLHAAFERIKKALVPLKRPACV